MHVIKNRTLKIASICIFLIFGSLVTLVRYNQNSSPEKYPTFKLDENFKQADIVWTYNLTATAQIYIDDSYTWSNWSNAVITYDWITGAGTEGNPYEIKNVLYDGEYYNRPNLITVKNSVAHFRIEDCILYNAYYDYTTPNTGVAILLENVENGIITNVDTSDCTNGIKLVNSEYNRIQGIIARNNVQSGIIVSGGSKNRIKNCTISNGSGIKLVDGTFNNDIMENTITTGVYDYDGYDYYYDDIGISLSNSHYNNVTFNTIFDYQENSGISLSGSNYNNISGNTIRDSGTGLKLVSSDNNLVSANPIGNSSYGVYISSSSINSVNKNNISNNRFYGIYIENSDHHSIVENILMNNGADDIYLINTLEIHLALNEMFGSGLYFEIPYSDIADINIETSNLVNDKSLYFYINQSGLGQADFINAGQVFLYDCDDVNISGMEFNFVTTGITVVNCIDITITSNEALNNSRWAFNIFNSTNIKILNNDVIYSSIILENSNHTKFIENTISYSMTDGVSFKNCHNNYISGNTASYSMKNGISLENCHNNYISGNTANYNREFGIRLYKTNHGLIHNNIANNNDGTGISVSGNNYYYLLNITLTSNEANDNGGNGMVIEYVDNIIITGNTAKRNIYGIALRYFEAGIGIITENEVTGNKYGLTIEFGLEVHVNNNTVISNGRFWGMSYLEIDDGEGLLIFSCQKIEVSDNLVNLNAQGIVIYSCGAGEVKDNHLSGNGREASFLFFINTPTGDHGILFISSANINVTGNNLNDNGIGVSGCSNIRLLLNQIIGFGFILIDSAGNIISGNLITDALIAIDLYGSSFNNITYNIIIAQQCFREKGNCTANVFEDNECTEVLPSFYLREIVSIVGIASVLGINIPLLLKKRKERK